MTEYKNRMTLVVPEALMSSANQLALIVGESDEDIKTFVNTIFKDELGNLYSACSTLIKPIVLDMLGADLGEAPLQSELADLELAQEALNSVVMFSEGVDLQENKIIVAIDVEPEYLFNSLGLSDIDYEV